MSFLGKTCVITGGAQGIGKCVAQQFAKQGARVAIIDKDFEKGQETLQELHCEGVGALFFHGDVASRQELEQFSEEVVHAFGKVDVLVNNACLSRRGILSGCGYEDFDYVLKVGVLAPYMLAKLFLPVFAPGASIVNISSTRAFMSQADTESYSAAKGGITALTHALAASLAGKARVNSIAPGWIDTGAYHGGGYVPQHSEADRAQHTSGRVGDPMDIAQAVLFLSDERNGFINGQNLTVDGGMTRLMVYSGDAGWQYHV